MNRHNLEKGLMGGFLLVSLVFAICRLWSPASYFLFLAAFVDFDDWTNSGPGRSGK